MRLLHRRSDSSALDLWLWLIPKSSIVKLKEWVLVSLSNVIPLVLIGDTVRNESLAVLQVINSDVDITRSHGCREVLGHIICGQFTIPLLDKILQRSVMSRLWVLANISDTFEVFVASLV